MSDMTRNALAELAETLHTIAANTDTMFPNAIGTASRIVAELAKVGFEYFPIGKVYCASAKESLDALNKCRAIAEEGADNGNR